MTPTLPWNGRGRAVKIVLALCAIGLFASFVALGTWQIQRRAWKHALIERVDQRVHAAPAAAPALAAWPQVSAASDEYSHVLLNGQFILGRDTLVQAATVLGSGFWLLSPLRLADGSVVLVNRGFVPPEARTQPATVAAAPARPVAVTGLLRMTEPGGGFLRKNDASANRWYSRDVAAIAAARGLGPVAPYFVDADAATVAHAASVSAATSDDTQPIAGLTVVAFHDSHLVYALTWYALALMLAAGVVITVAVQNAKRDQEPPDAPQA